MIPKLSKFPLRTDFLHFRARAKRISSPLFTIHYAPSPTPSRLAVIVPKKLSKLATTRNWLKRLTYDTVWPLIKDKNLDCIVVYKPLTLTKSPTTHNQLITELKQWLAKDIYG